MTCPRCEDKGWYLNGNGIPVVCLDCKYIPKCDKRPSLNEPFQEVYDKAKIIENNRNKENIIKEDKDLMDKVNKIKKLSKKDKEEWIEYNRLQNKFVTMKII